MTREAFFDQVYCIHESFNDADGDAESIFLYCR